MSEVSVSPKKRRRWWVGLLVLLIAVGGGVWWCNRLTPEERVLVGRWRYTIQTPQGASDELNIEFRNDRTAHGTEIFLRWAARKGQVDLQVIPTNSEVRSYFHLWIQSGFKDWPGPDTRHGRMEIIDHDTVRITMELEESDDQVTELKRITEK